MYKVRKQLFLLQEWINLFANMSVLSILKNVKVGLKYIIPVAILIVCVLNNAHCGGHSSQFESAGDSAGYEKLPNCNENIIQDRESTHR